MSIATDLAAALDSVPVNTWTDATDTEFIVRQDTGRMVAWSFDGDGWTASVYLPAEDGETYRDEESATDGDTTCDTLVARVAALVMA